VPVLIGLGARWSGRSERVQLEAMNDALQVENGNFRENTGELTTQIQALENVIDGLGARSALDPPLAKAMYKLAASVSARARGRRTRTNAAISNVTSVISASLTPPEDPFGVLRTLLQSLEGRLRNARKDVENQEALAAATPSIWPAHGWLT